MKIMMIPSVSGGLGHVGRTSALARALTRIDPALTIEYLLDMERIRPFNIEVVAATGHRVNLLPIRSRNERDAVVRATLGDADIIVDDTSRHLIPLRALLPGVRWISVPMYPLWDELFMDWPLLAQTDGIVWAYPQGLDFPSELNLIRRPVVKTGPFLDVEDVPSRAEARAQLGYTDADCVILYAPRGMTFGRAFGEQVLASVVGAVGDIQVPVGKRVRLELVSVRDPDEIRCPEVPDPLPGCVHVVGPLPPHTMLTYIRAADVAVTEGSNMTFEAAALRTPILMVPGTIHETWVLGTHLRRSNAAVVLWIETVTVETVKDALHDILDNDGTRAARVERAEQMLMQGGGAEAAARFVLQMGTHGAAASAE
ncbi:MAG: hypothetical protein M3Z31_01125 [Pseudomonadota bacterium]|nr:hypothetical protein [Pseudomonadota bacterium]